MARQQSPQSPQARNSTSWTRHNCFGGFPVYFGSWLASVPEGQNDNSPTFQRWERRSRARRVPKGRLTVGTVSAVPSGLAPTDDQVPNVETLGYYQPSLRDDEWQFLVALDLKIRAPAQRTEAADCKSALRWHPFAGAAGSWATDLPTEIQIRQQNQQQPFHFAARIASARFAARVRAMFM